MQSTGVYWMPVFEILEQHGLEVYLVNARHTKNVPGRKSDIQECQWLLKLHAFGLLNNSFQPTDEIRVARTLWRQRGNLVAEAAQRDSADAEGADRDERSTQQRAERPERRQRNERSSEPFWKGNGIPGLLAALVEPEVKATLQEIAKSLEGNWREELVFVLGQQVELYRFYQEKIADCDVQLRQHLESFGSKVDLTAQPIGPKPKGKKGSRNAPQFDLRTELYRITGIDWAQINGIDVLTAQTVIAEAGADLSAFPSEKQFASWLGLCPTNETKRRQNTESPDTKSGQSGHRGVPQRGLDPAAKPKLSGSAIPPPAHPARRPQSHHRHGSKVSLPVLPAHQARTAVRR